jgi:hypothetical protein
VVDLVNVNLLVAMLQPLGWPFDTVDPEVDGQDAVTYEVDCRCFSNEL